MAFYPAKKVSFLFALFLVAFSAQAQNFSSTSLELTHGFAYCDSAFGYNTTDQQMTTVMFEHFATWKYGANFLLLAYYMGDFANREGRSTGNQNQVYSEFTSMLYLSKILGKDKFELGPVREVIVPALQINIGNGYRAYLLGGGLAFNTYEGSILEAYAFYKANNFNFHTYQLSLAWKFPFNLGDATFSFSGFSDYQHSQGMWGHDLYVQPRFFWHLSETFGFAPALGKLDVGVDLYIHQNEEMGVYVPQPAVRWSF